MKFLIKTLLYFFCFAFSIYGFSQDTTSIISGYSDQNLEVVENKNYQKITNMTYGNIVEMARGSDLLIVSLKEVGNDAESLTIPVPLYNQELVIPYKPEAIIIEK